MAKYSFEKKLERLSKPKIGAHALGSPHIRKLSKEGVAHPESVSPKGVHELCDAIVARNDEDDVAGKY